MPALPEHALMLSGPTAAGKSECAVALARRLSGEIVSVDSMQVYRALDIGTAKPSVDDRRAVPHHLIDVVECHDTFDAARFVTLAQLAITEITKRGRRPILCGGTGLYFKALLEGLGESPSPDASLRATLQRLPLEELLHELAEKDPATFERIDRKNSRRVIRAVEILRQTGRPVSLQRARWQSGTGGADGNPRPSAVVFVLRRNAEDLQARIARRVDRMFADGLVAETRELLSRGLADNPVALQAIGYRQAVEHLRGERSLAETIELVKIKTRQFAKRQMTWFRHQLPSHWIDVAPDESADSVADQILNSLNTMESQIRSRP